MLQHEISEGFVRKVGRNYFMILTIDGQRQQRKTGTNNLDKAVEMLEDWKAQAKAGVVEEARLRYEAMRDEYTQKGGKQVQESILRDLNMFFKNIRVSAITVKKLDEFRAWRESLPQVVEYRNETLAKEIAPLCRPFCRLYRHRPQKRAWRNLQSNNGDRLCDFQFCHP